MDFDLTTAGAELVLSVTQAVDDPVFPYGQYTLPLIVHALCHWSAVVLAKSLSGVAPPPIFPHRRLPAHLQYATALHQSTQTTGLVGVVLGLNVQPLPTA